MLIFVSFHCCLFFFFFSSRRRHTRSLCDWSSDVCSSDLIPFAEWRSVAPAYKGQRICLPQRTEPLQQCCRHRRLRTPRRRRLPSIPIEKTATGEVLRREDRAKPPRRQASRLTRLPWSPRGTQPHHKNQTSPKGQRPGSRNTGKGHRRAGG